MTDDGGTNIILESAGGKDHGSSKTRCVWPSAVTSSKYAQRIVMVMRSEERVDRVFSENWMKTEVTNEKVNSTDQNIPASQMKHWNELNSLKNNSPITVLGKYKAILVGRALLNRQIAPARIVCSPALRCIETAVAIAEYLKISVAVGLESGLSKFVIFYIEPGLCEHGAITDFTNVDMLINGMPIDYDYIPLLTINGIVKETEKDAMQRIRRVLRALIDQPRKRPLFVVAHAVVQSTLSNLASGVPFQEQTVEDQVVDPVELDIRFELIIIFSTMSGNNIAAVATALSGLALIPILFSGAYLYNEISSFYDQSLEDLQQFKIYANDAWSGMVPSNMESVASFSQLVGRNKRSGDSCNCGPQPNNCPQGPPGPPGVAGAAGDDGAPGEPGTPGEPGQSTGPKHDTKECIKCPAGAPGPAGPDGEAGPAGPDGENGTDGAPGKDGEPGAAGEQGDAGEPGAPGENGKDGEKGANGTKGKGAPGPAGPEGPAGPAGNPGANGENGQDGQPGQDGPEGPAGQPGKDGEPGAPGEAGQPGTPGPDAAYCPCPPRTSVAAIEEAQKSSGYRA